jgi:hypothetical protein
MNLQETSRASSFTSNLLVAVLIGFATVVTACPPDMSDRADSTRAESTPLVPNDLR